MRDLTLVGLSEDLGYAVLRDAEGARFRVPADERLRAFLRNDRARLGQLEIDMDSALRPRDIQARIRRGESPESVADVAKVPVEKVMTYAGPVLAEREHMCARARASTTRRRSSAGSAIALGELVDAGLRADGADPDAAVWDSWRREDGRWTITVRVGDEAADYVFDPPGRYAVPDNDAARRLVGDVEPPADTSDMAIATAVAAPSDPLVAPTAGAPEADLDEPGVTSLKQARARRAMAQDQLMLDAETGMPGRPVADRDGLDADAEPTVDLEETAEQVRAASGGDASESRSRKRRDRRRVPSWDEIMFGRADT